MRKKIFYTIIFVLGLLAIFSAYALFRRLDSEFWRDIKIVAFFMVLIVYIISLVVIAIGENDVVKHPFAAAISTAFIAGIVSGFLMFKSPFMVMGVVFVYVAVVGGIEYKFHSFSNKVKKK